MGMPLWFEKTVEYRFVLDILDREAVASPLDGHAETWWGDLIDSRNAEFRLIEFKRTESAINTELDKYLPPGAQRSNVHYTQYVTQTLRNPLFSLPGARGHWLVFGGLDAVAWVDRSGQGLKLKARSYSEIESSKTFALDHDTQLSRVSAAELHPYLVALRKLRSVSDASTSEGMVLATVGGASSMWTTQEFLTITERALGLTQTLQHEPRHQREYDMPRGR
jgi:hypothetical protein